MSERFLSRLRLACGGEAGLIVLARMRRTGELRVCL